MVSEAKWEPVTFGPPMITIEEVGRRKWSEFHTMELTPESLAEWEAGIPSFGCDCKSKYREIKAANPPRFEDPHRWKWEIHNAVNAKLGKPLFAWEDYAARWLSR